MREEPKRFAAVAYPCLGIFHSTGSSEPVGNVRCAYGSPQELRGSRGQRRLDGGVSRRSFGRGALVSAPGLAEASVGVSKGLLSRQVRVACIKV